MSGVCKRSCNDSDKTSLGFDDYYDTIYTQPIYKLKAFHCLSITEFLHSSRSIPPLVSEWISFSPIPPAVSERILSHSIPSSEQMPSSLPVFALHSSPLRPDLSFNSPQSCSPIGCTFSPSLLSTVGQAPCRSSLNNHTLHSSLMFFCPHTIIDDSVLHNTNMYYHQWLPVFTTHRPTILCVWTFPNHFLFFT